MHLGRRCSLCQQAADKPHKSPAVAQRQCRGKWCTHADLISNAKGEANTPAYSGWYDVAVEKDGKTKTLEVKHAVSGSRPVVKLP